MSDKGENVILPSNAVFLVHKVGTSKAGRGTQWETRTKAMRAAPDPNPVLSIANSKNDTVKTKGDAAEGGASWEFVSYTPRNVHQLPRRPKDKEPKRKRRVQKDSNSHKNKNTSLVSVKQEPKLLRDPDLLPPDLPVALVGHALLYINFCTFFSVPCSLHYLSAPTKL